jgi:hypothetical protein
VVWKYNLIFALSNYLNNKFYTMSHFTVLVIGKNPEKQLKPYNEGLEVPEYCKGVVSSEDVQGFIEFYTKEEKGVVKHTKNREEYYTLIDGVIWKHQTDGLSIAITPEELYEIKGDDWNGCSWRFEEGEVREYSTYNPNSKWDWYELGGRWTGYFKIKDGGTGAKGKPGLMTELAKPGYADQLLKKDIDIEFMRKEDGEKAAKQYDAAMEIINNTPDCESWEAVLARFGKDNIDETRNFYHSQLRIIAWRESGKFSYFSSPEDFTKYTREQYIKNAEDAALVPFAVLKDGKWYERGEMLMFGMVANEKEQDTWNAEFAAMFDALPDDTLLSLYDCHI